MIAKAAAQNVAILSAETLYLQCLDYQRVMADMNRNWPHQTSFNAMQCLGAILAMNTMLNDLSRQTFLNRFKICSINLTPMQASDMYVHWMKRNPSLRAGFASDKYLGAMLEHFGCDKHPWTR